MNFFTQTFDYIINKTANSENSNSQVSHPFFNQNPLINTINNTAPMKYVPQTNQLRMQRINTTPKVENVCIAPDGTRLARVIRVGNVQRLTVRMSQNVDKLCLQLSNPIEKIAFVGSRYLACVVQSGNKTFANYSSKHIKLIDLDAGVAGVQLAELSPVNNAVDIDLIPSKNSESLSVISYDGNRYFTHSIDVHTGKFQLIVEGNFPPVLDQNLQPRIYYKSATSILGIIPGYDVFAIPEGGSAANSVQIDHINDPKKESYISIVGNVCYKFSVQNNNSLLISSINLGDGSRIDMGAIDGVQSLSACRINLATDGSLLFLTVGNDAKRQNIPMIDGIQQCLTFINNQFGGIGWYRISSTADNGIWILCACTQPNNRYFLYDLQNNSMQEVPTNELTSSSTAMTYRSISSTPQQSRISISQ
ncbi:MAG: hypothetical protein IJ730_01725 [Alphaproteobacteria bacterium]|nr:hypothetical protein [Alphaproteobacteria bacterium]